MTQKIKTHYTETPLLSKVQAPKSDLNSRRVLGIYREIMRLLLFPLAMIYRLAGFFRNVGYDLGIFSIKAAPLPVISIGNLSFGGSEKTPLAMKLIGMLSVKDYRPALVSRGYRGNWERTGGILSDGKSRRGTWQDSGDEPFMLALNFPEAGVFVGQSRLASCGRAAEMGFKPAVLDDGFQHRGLARDIDIVLFDPHERIMLREAVSALKRADIILLKKSADAGLKQRWTARFSQAAWFEYEVVSRGFHSLQTRVPADLDDLKGESVLAFCGIAKPLRFKALLEKEGIQPREFHTFNDHHGYPRASIQKLIKLFDTTQAKAMITTEKDAIKLTAVSEFEDIPLYYLKIDLDIEKDFLPEVFFRLRSVEQQR